VQSCPSSAHAGPAVSRMPEAPPEPAFKAPAAPWVWFSFFGPPQA